MGAGDAVPGGGRRERLHAVTQRGVRPKPKPAETDPTKGVEIVGENTTAGRHQSGAARQKASGGLDSHNEVGG